MIYRIVFVTCILLTLAVAAGVRFSLLLGIGLLIGYSLERSGFGFAGPWRRLILERNGQGVMAQLLAIGLTAIIIQPLIAYAPGSFIGAIGPISVSMIIAACVFGFCMQIILGCGSGTLINAGSGNLIAIIALPLFCLGSFLGTLLIPLAVKSTPHVAISLTTLLGVEGSVVGTVIGLVCVGFIVSKLTQGTLWNKRLIFVAIALATLAVAHVLVAGQPWGVVYGLGLWVAKAAQGLGWSPGTAEFWINPVNSSVLQSPILTDTTSLTNLGLIVGAAIAAWRDAGQKPLVESLELWIYGVVIVASILLGISSRLAFGCNVGALFSGIASGSVHGWVWLIAGFCGSIAGVRVRDRLWQKASAGQA